MINYNTCICPLHPSMIDSLKAMTIIIIGDIDSDSDAWLTLVDSSGLWHINDKVYAVFAK